MRKKWIMSSILVLLFTLVAALPAVGAESSALISAEELNDILNGDNVVIIDIRDAEAYKAGHIPGAISVQASEFYEDRDGVQKLAAGPEKFSALLSSNGIDEDSQVIIYTAGKDLKYATRAWWVFHMYGLQNAQVLDGGIDAWKALGYELSDLAVTPSTTKHTVTEANIQQNTVATTEEVKDALDSNAVIVDCRNTDYFQGKIATGRHGHITGAILITAGENLNDDMTYKNVSTLAELYSNYGITAETPVITYCNTGTTATVHYFALTQILGYQDVQLYDASMKGWANDSSLPMESNYDFFVIGSPVAKVNSTQINLSAEPFVENGRSFVDANVLAESLELNVTVTDDNVILESDEKTFEVANPIVKDDITFLPVRQVAKAFGGTISWDGENKGISIFMP